MLNEGDFDSRLEAALALRREREGREERGGSGHRKDKKTATAGGGGGGGASEKRERGKNRRRKSAFFPVRGGGGGGVAAAAAAAAASEDDVDDDAILAKGEEGGGEDATANVDAEEDAVIVVETTMEDEVEMEEEQQQPPEIDPRQSLFDDVISDTPADNLARMRSEYSFFLPDSEYLVDLEGFLGYCNEKVRWGNVCLYCQKSFGSAEATLKHMRDKRHCKIAYERGVDMEEYDVFYDFSTMAGGIGGDVGAGKKKKKKKKVVIDRDAAMEEEEEEEEEEWEDVPDDDDDASMDESEDDDDDDDDDDDGMYDAYEREINTRGIDITPLGELIFPDGRIVGHRCLARYYRQRYAPDRMERAAVRHAREGAGDRLHGGRVVNLHRSYGGDAGGGGGAGAAGGGGAPAALAIMGRASGSIPPGRGGGGILVSAGGGGGGGVGGTGGFTSLSLYRYRAAVKKQRREDDRGQRLQYRTRMNMNKMNKKGNNIATGVVTAKLPR
jgi:pre-60S factor REI1